MDNEARLLLDDAIAFCRRDGLDTRLINMLASARATNLTEDALTIEAPSRFAYSYLVKQRTVIERYLEEIAFAPLALNITVPQIDEWVEVIGHGLRNLCMWTASTEYQLAVPHLSTSFPILLKTFART